MTQLFFLNSHFVELAGIFDRNRDFIRDPYEQRHLVAVGWLLVFAIHIETADRLSFDYEWDDRTHAHPFLNQRLVLEERAGRLQLGGTRLARVENQSHSAAAMGDRPALAQLASLLES